MIALERAYRKVAEASDRVQAGAAMPRTTALTRLLGIEHPLIQAGSEAGGHRGSFLVAGDDGPVGTLALVPQVVDAVGVPVFAAGRIADGRGLAAALALGAGGGDDDHARLLRSPGPRGPQPRRTGSRRPARLPRAVLAVRAARRRGGEARLERVPRDVGGTGAPLARELPAAELVAQIIGEAREVLAALA